MYYFMFVLGFVFLIFYNYKFHYVYNISRKRAMWYTLTFAYGMLGANIMGRIYTKICFYNDIEDASRLAIFGAVIFAPVFILLTLIIEKWIRANLQNKQNVAYKKRKDKKHIESISIRDTLDLLTPGLFMTIALGKIGCMIEGCCFGIECTWGVYSDKINSVVFPVQLFESIALMLLLVVCYFIKRTNFYRRGMAYPLTALGYCVLRFFFEYMRYYETELRHLFFGITLWQGLCLIVIVVSFVAVYLLYKREDSSPLPSVSLCEKSKKEKTS